jgi:hypothetical protein
MSEEGSVEHAGAKSVLGSERNIYEFIEAMMRPRLGSYLGGTRSIENLEIYLAGYQGALSVNRITEHGCPPFFLFFFWLVETRPGAWERGWARQLLLETDGDNEIALDTFFKLAAEFGSLQEVEGEFVELDREYRRPLNVHDAALARLGSSPRAVPTLIQLIHLRPGHCCYIRETFGPSDLEHLILFRDVATAKNAVRLDLGVGLDKWSSRRSLD